MSELAVGHTRPEHLGDPYIGAWYVPDCISTELAEAVQVEVNQAGFLSQFDNMNHSDKNINDWLLI